MANLFDGRIGKLGPFLAAFNSAGCSGELFEAVADDNLNGDNSLAKVMVAAGLALVAAGQKVAEAFLY